MIKKITLILTFTIMTPANAGFHAFTMHSRANCGGFNESVSWHFHHPNYLITFSEHYNENGLICNVNSNGWRYTWRAAAYHYKEGYGGWYVRGYHWGYDKQRQVTVLLKVTEAINCNIYDGWWNV